MEFTNDDIASLGDKLAALDLTDGEAEALRTMTAIAAAATGDEDEVTGYYSVWIGGSVKADFGSLSSKVGPPTGLTSGKGDQSSTSGGPRKA